jgi:hypothetical protein
LHREDENRLGLLARALYTADGGFDIPRKRLLTSEPWRVGLSQIFELREDLERLLLLEKVVAHRQEAVEKRLDDALEAGLTPEQLRTELDLSPESARQLLELDPALAERIGILG